MESSFSAFPIASRSGKQPGSCTLPISQAATEPDRCGHNASNARTHLVLVGSTAIAASCLTGKRRKEEGHDLFNVDDSICSSQYCITALWMRKAVLHQPSKAKVFLLLACCSAPCSSSSSSLAKNTGVPCGFRKIFSLSRDRARAVTTDAAARILDETNTSSFGDGISQA